MLLDSNFNWRDYVDMQVSDPQHRHVMERTLDLISQTQDGQELLLRARQNGGGRMQLRSDGQFRFGEREVDLSGPGRAVIEPDGRGGWASGVQVQPQHYLTGEQLATGTPSQGFMDLVVHEFQHVANPRVHPTVVRPQVESMIADAAQRAVADSPVDEATRTRLAQDLTQNWRQRFGLPDGDQPVGSTGLEVGDIQEGIQSFTRNEPTMDEVGSAVRQGREPEAPLDAYRREAAARLGIPEDAIRIRPTDGSGPLFAPSDNPEAGIRRPQEEMIPADELAEMQRAKGATPAQSGDAASTPPSPGGAPSPGGVPQPELSDEARRQAEAAMARASTDPAVETQATRYANAFRQRNFAQDGSAPQRDGYRDTMRFYTSPEALQSVPGVACSTENQPVYDPGPDVEVAGELRSPPRIGTGACMAPSQATAR